MRHRGLQIGCWLGCCLLSAAWGRAEAPSPPIVPRPDRVPAVVDPPLAGTPGRLDANSMVIENRSSRTFRYQIYQGSGEALSRPYELGPNQSHRFANAQMLAQATRTQPRPIGVPGYMFVTYRSEKYRGSIVEKLFTNKRYVYVENSGGYGELIERTERINELRPTAPVTPITDADEEVARILILSANHNFEPDHPAHIVGPIRLRVEDLTSPRGTAEVPEEGKLPQPVVPGAGT